MSHKLNNLFSFRDKKEYEPYFKGAISATLIYFLVTIGFICAGNTIDIMVFMVIPLLFISSFLRKNDYLFLLAELVTIGGDIALMLYHYRPVGFSIYLVVQLIYAAYFFFRDSNRKREIIITIIRPIAMLLAALLTYFIMKSDFNFIMCMAVIYYVNLLINIVCAIILKDWLLVVGFALFALSDFIIGMDMLLPKSNPFRQFLSSFNFMHFFYLTSQVILMFNKHNNEY